RPADAAPLPPRDNSGGRTPREHGDAVAHGLGARHPRHRGLDGRQSVLAPRLRLPGAAQRRGVPRTVLTWRSWAGLAIRPTGTASQSWRIPFASYLCVGILGTVWYSGDCPARARRLSCDARAAGSLGEISLWGW